MIKLLNNKTIKFYLSVMLSVLKLLGLNVLLFLFLSFFGAFSTKPYIEFVKQYWVNEIQLLYFWMSFAFSLLVNYAYLKSENN